MSNGALLLVCGVVLLADGSFSESLLGGAILEYFIRTPLIGPSSHQLTDPQYFTFSHLSSHFDADLALPIHYQRREDLPA